MALISLKQLLDHAAEHAYGLPVIAIATLTDLLQMLRSSADPALTAHVARVAAYRERYGA